MMPGDQETEKNHMHAEAQNQNQSWPYLETLETLLVLG